MKRLPLLLTIAILTPLLSFSQNQTGAKTSPGLTVTPATSNTSANPNRQQELYDQYHGITKKPGTQPAPAQSGNMSRTQPGKSNDRARPERPAKPALAVSKPERAAPAAAESSASGIRIGLRGGVTYPVFLEEAVGISRDPALGFTGGIVFQFGSGALSFQPEINYTRNALKAVFDDGFGNKTKITGAVDQVQIPLLLKIASGDVNSNRFFVNIGPYAAYALNISENGKTQSLSGAKGRFGFGAAAGIGAALKAGPGHLTIELRGLYSLGNTDSGFNTDSKTINTQATLGYIIPLGGR